MARTLTIRIMPCRASFDVHGIVVTVVQLVAALSSFRVMSLFVVEG